MFRRPGAVRIESIRREGNDSEKKYICKSFYHGYHMQLWSIQAVVAMRRGSISVLCLHGKLLIHNTLCGWGPTKHNSSMGTSRMLSMAAIFRSSGVIEVAVTGVRGPGPIPLLLLMFLRYKEPCDAEKLAAAFSRSTGKACGNAGGICQVGIPAMEPIGAAWADWAGRFNCPGTVPKGPERSMLDGGAIFCGASPICEGWVTRITTPSAVVWSWLRLCIRGSEVFESWFLSTIISWMVWR